jgi:cobalt-zinc-cadmium efflux system protein
MAHEHGHDHAAGANEKALLSALALTSLVLVAEIAGGVVFKSLALLSDAAHMFTDAAALAIAFAAVRVGRWPADARRTFGYRRFEILAAAFNAVLLFLIAGWILYEAWRRLMTPEPVASAGMLAVAAFGLIANLVAMRILRTGSRRSVNVRGAYLEVFADMLASLGVIAGAALIWATGWLWVDPVIAVGIGLWVLPRAWSLLRETANTLLEGAPKGLDMDALRQAMLAEPGVQSVHDLHAWEISTGLPSLSVHVVATEEADPDIVRRGLSAMLHAKFKIDHATLQVEREACEAHDMHL